MHCDCVAIACFSLNSSEFIGATVDVPDTRGPISGDVYLQDLASGNSIIKFSKLKANFNADELAFNLDGKLMAITQQDYNKTDGNVMLWDISANQLVNKFKAYEDKSFNNATERPERLIKSLSLSADGSTLAILGQDGKVMLWHTGLDELLMQGCQQARNYLATLDEKNSDRHLCDNVPSTPVNSDK
ncbi:hypothetical protein SD80_013530 [Scytonema tolypothrichoides VB-61278]|nr:hypothetical protein SD80_013530 [Scytonema tolypothrichoides VB-61278]